MDKISIFGQGFIGKRFLELYPNESIGVISGGFLPKSNDILITRSTTHNYYPLEGDVFTDIEVNIIQLMEILEAFRLEKKTGTINFCSSWFVYNEPELNKRGSNSLPVDEGEFCYPKGFYSITKYTAEQLLQSYCQTFKLNYRIFRLSNIFGVTDKPTAKKNALQFLLNEIVNNRPINLYYGGQVYRDMLWVDDCCTAMYNLMVKAPLNEIYNVGYGVSYSFHELIDIAQSYSGYTGVETSIEPPDFHKQVQVRNFFMNTNKAKHFGLRPTKSIKLFIPEYIDWIKSAKLSIRP